MPVEESKNNTQKRTKTYIPSCYTHTASIHLFLDVKGFFGVKYKNHLWFLKEQISDGFAFF